MPPPLIPEGPQDQIGILHTSIHEERHYLGQFHGWVAGPFLRLRRAWQNREWLRTKGLNYHTLYPRNKSQQSKTKRASLFAYSAMRMLQTQQRRPHPAAYKSDILFIGDALDNGMVEDVHSGRDSDPHTRSLRMTAAHRLWRRRRAPLPPRIRATTSQRTWARTAPTLLKMAYQETRAPVISYCARYPDNPLESPPESHKEIRSTSAGGQSHPTDGQTIVVAITKRQRESSGDAVRTSTYILGVVTKMLDTNHEAMYQPGGAMSEISCPHKGWDCTETEVCLCSTPRLCHTSFSRKAALPSNC